MKKDNELSEKSYAPHVALLLVQICFGSLPVVGKIVLKTIPAFALVGFRVGVTAVILLIWQRFKGDLRLPDKRDYRRFALLSLFGITLNQLFFIGGLSLTKASNSSLLAVTIPIFTLTGGAILGVERLRKLKVFGIILAAIGVVLLIDPRNASFSSETTLGDFLIILNSLCYGIYVSVSKEIVTRNGAIKSMTWIFIFASIICIPLGLYSISSIDVSQINSSVWLLILYVAVVATAAPYLLNAWALARVNPSTVAVYIYLQPLIGFCLATFYLRESFTRTTVAAGILIFIGVFLVTKKRKL
jgi:drug/metabolite transporter (DMT)-like permease